MVSRRTIFGATATLAPALIWAGLLLVAWLRHEPEGPLPAQGLPAPPDMLELRMNGVRLSVPMTPGVHARLREPGTEGRWIAFGSDGDPGREALSADGVPEAHNVTIAVYRLARSPSDPFAPLRQRAVAERGRYSVATLGLTANREYVPSDRHRHVALPPLAPPEKWVVSEIGDRIEARFVSHRSAHVISCSRFTLPSSDLYSCTYTANDQSAALKLISDYYIQSLNHSWITTIVDDVFQAASVFVHG